MTFRLAFCVLALCLTLPALAALQVIDDEGNTLEFDAPTQRIISLAPHITELLFAAGAGTQVVGTVAYSDHPTEALSVPRVGSYNNVDVETVISLQPDLVIAWGSSTRHAHLDHLAALGIPVFISEPRSLDDIAHSLQRLGLIAGTESQAEAAAATFRTRLQRLSAYTNRTPVRVFYQVSPQPLMTVSDDHLISAVIRLCGGENVFGALAPLAPHIDVESVIAANPEAIVASGIDASRPAWLNEWQRWGTLTAVRNDHLFHIHPDLIQRHTPRILEGAERLCQHLETVRNVREQSKNR